MKRTLHTVGINVFFKLINKKRGQFAETTFKMQNRKHEVMCKNLYSVRYKSHLKQMLNLFLLGKRRVNNPVRESKKTSDIRKPCL